MKRNKKVVRIIAIVLAVLLAGGVIVGALYSAFAMAEEAPKRDRQTITMEYLETEQALRIEQRLVYYNRTSDTLDRLLFYAAPNMLRRESALMYEPDDLESVFYAGYAPGGMELREVTVDGSPADYGFQGEEELYLRVACAIAPGECAEFVFRYYLLLTRCGAFVGVGETDVRLGAFYFIPAIYDGEHQEFMLTKPLPFTRWLHCNVADYEVRLSLPDDAPFEVACTGRVERERGSSGLDEWHMEAQNAREFAMCFGKRYRVTERVTTSGVKVRVLSGRRDADRVAQSVCNAIERCEDWFGPFPMEVMSVAESDYPLGTLNYPGLTMVSGVLMDDSRMLNQKLRFCVAQQYFGLSAYVEPSADAWLSDSVSQYIAYLLMEAEEGHDAFQRAINRDWVNDLQLTIPGGLNVTSDASRFNAREYAVIVLTRGAVVLHELRQAMGLEPMLEGLGNFYRLGQDGRTLTEMDFVHCMNEADGGDWEDFLTDWVFNVDDYVNQSIDWLS